MTECLRLKKSNCKNCYKCIRNCPVKSIRFSDNQANIVPEECILCGHCFVACPQGAKEIRNDVPVARTLIASARRFMRAWRPPLWPISMAQPSAPWSVRLRRSASRALRKRQWAQHL